MHDAYNICILTLFCPCDFHGYCLRMAADTATSLRRFVQENDLNFTFDNVNEEAKEIVLTHCAQLLYREQEPEDLLNCLRCLRILSRDKQSIDQLSSEVYMSRLFDCAFLTGELYDDKHRLEALKCLSNLVFKRPSVIPYLKSRGIVNSLLTRLKQHLGAQSRIEILTIDLKLFFLLSGLETTIRQELAEDEHAFGLFADLLSSFQSASLTGPECHLIVESLKAAYNIGYAVQRDCSILKSRIPEFSRFCDAIRELLPRASLSDADQRQVVEQMVNFLNVVPKRCFTHLLFKHTGSVSTVLQSSSNADNMRAVQTLLDFLDMQLNSSNDETTSRPVLNLEETLCPILNALIKASQGNRSIRKYCRSKILPHLGSDVTRLPEEGSTLRNRLCKLLTSPLQGVSELVALFLFVLCKEDIGRAIKYTGFGNFAGFLARHALLGGASKKRARTRVEQMESGVAHTSDGMNFTEDDSAEDYSTASSASDTEEYERLRDSVNPVTGRWEEAKPHPLEGMSEEQKEYITMELVNKIDQLHRTGLIQPGTIGDDGNVRPVGHILEMLENTHVKESSQSDSD
ncbi:hypothetical protein P879_02399 [Paragonimus westermani]|uniref:Synembryn-A n=1 Tax=Paragonimus westermani TaxID=34504 RepID=A0A8T0DVR3_9TREM|nr:hypothetical protein P879_02399 [Paragonimus westermani]